MKFQGSLPGSQHPDTGPYSEPDESSSYCTPHSFKIHLISSSHLRLGLRRVLSPSDFRTNVLWISQLLQERYMHGPSCANILWKCLLPFSLEYFFLSPPLLTFKSKLYTIIILPVVLCECETWSFTLREEHRLSVSGNNSVDLKVMKWQEAG
jgi:hypothetical protein